MHILSPPSSAHVRIITAINATFQDAFQFDDADDVTWDFNNKTFTMDVKRDFEDAAPPLLSFTSGAGDIIIDDATLRILHFNVSRSAIQVSVVPGTYYYDLLMTDTITNVITALMHGDFVVTDGITGV